VKKNKLLSVLAIATFSTALMAADDKIDYSFSLKSWNNKISQGNNTNTVNGTVISATAKKGDFFITGSRLLPVTYTNSEGSSFGRQDSDIALGWSFSPNLSVLGGKKIIGSTTGSGSIFNIPYFGLNGFSSIDEKSFLYGTFTRSPKVSASATITRSGTITFTNYEGGYGYLWDKSTQLTVGYRSQTISNVNPSATLAGVIFGANFSF
jgi:hypothetical protein